MGVTLEDVKTVIGRLVDDSLNRVALCEALMDHLRCKEDILRFRFVPEALIAVRALLDRFAQAGAAVNSLSHQYREPARLSPPPPDDMELMALFQFFKRMHATFWEVRVRLKTLASLQRLVKDLEKAAALLRLARSARDILDAAVVRLATDLPAMLAERTAVTARRVEEIIHAPPYLERQAAAQPHHAHIIQLDQVATSIQPPAAVAATAEQTSGDIHTEKPPDSCHDDERLVKQLSDRQVGILFELRKLSMRADALRVQVETER